MRSVEQLAEVPLYNEATRNVAQVGHLRLGIIELGFQPQRLSGLPVADPVFSLFDGPARVVQTLDGVRGDKRTLVSGHIIVRTPSLDHELETLDPLGVTVFGLRSDMVQSVTANFNANVPDILGRFRGRPFLSQLLAGLGSQIAESAWARCDRMYADALSFALIHELWRIADGNIPAAEKAPGCLSPCQLRRIDEVIAETLAEQINLEDLAASASMSMPAFSAAMKATTGQTPYQYVLTRRVDRAREMVETTALSLAEVAFRCGFASQSHMTDVFRAKLGTTPGKLRSDRA